ncbi:hypothetical protein LIER_40017 [Lithospermum erythrorhizon]|uniref:F-box domain-containing protein n=1 Tax=Lithospermum erythrorhizon TaxID=34254 RepID=A0AAV3QRE8_LITER
MQLAATNDVRFSKKVCSWNVCKLTDDLIIEILIWLPPKSATRFKSVCKSWCMIIKTRKFIEKHMQRAKPFIYFVTPSNPAPKANSFLFHSAVDGLILEVNSIQRYCRIRNHATTWNLVLPLPDSKRAYMTMSYLSSSEKYKVLNLQVRADAPSIFLDVLTVGVDVTWRPVEVPISCGNKRFVSSGTFDGVSYIMIYCHECCPPQMLAFQIEDERFVKIPMPQRVEVLCSSGRYAIKAIEFNKKFGLCCKFEEELHIWGLQDDEKAEWDEVKIVFLSSVVKQFSDIYKYIPYKIAGTEIFMMTHPMAWHFCYDFKSNKLLWDSKMSITIATSLVSLI